MKTIFKRPPDLVIGGHDDPYLLRWYILPRNRFLNVYLHKFIRSDDDRALHDHPWNFNASILLKGQYFEHVPLIPIDWPENMSTKRVLRKPGRIYVRRGSAAHRVELLKGYCAGKCNQHNKHSEKPVWTLFITGARVRDWGFYCPKGWRRHDVFLRPNENGESVVGRGCD